MVQVVHFYNYHDFGSVFEKTFFILLEFRQAHLISHHIVLCHFLNLLLFICCFQLLRSGFRLSVVRVDLLLQINPPYMV